MDKEQIRKALDHFENDEFTDAKEILQQEISKAKTDWLTSKLSLSEAKKEGDEDEDEDEDEDKMDEGSTEDAKKTLDAIIGALEKGDKNNDMLKMANGIKSTYEKNKGFSPDQAKWIYNTSKAMFK